jgi:hypothetical protein
MSLPSTGQISLSNIQTIMGGTNPISLSEYYQNASQAYTSGITGIPNINSVISLNLFRGKSKIIVQTIWQYFNNSYISDDEYALRVEVSKSTITMQGILSNVLSNPDYIGVYIYDGPEISANTWQISYISKAFKNTLTSTYQRYGSMTPFHPNNRYVYIHVNRATTEGVYVQQSYATLV